MHTVQLITPAANGSRGVTSRILLAATAAALLAIAATGCGGGESAHRTETPSGTAARQEPTIERQLSAVPGALVGRVTDTNALVAVVPGDGAIGVYICDRDNQGESGELSMWFRGGWDGRSAVTLSNGEMTIDIAPVGDRFTGVLTTVDGERLQFGAAASPSPGDGLYRVEKYDPATGAVIASRETIVFDDDERGVMISQTTRCYTVKRTRVQADGTVLEYYEQVCR